MIISEYHDIDEKKLEKEGILDIDLEFDTPVFIDPLLLRESRLLPNSYENLMNFFNMNTKLLDFKEIDNNHLGFSIGKSYGKGIGNRLVREIRANKNLKEIGIDFVEVFEEGIGVDRISDFITVVILDDLLSLTQKIAKKLKIKTKKFRIDVWCWEDKTLKNKKYLLPFYKEDYILFTPQEIVRRVNILSKEVLSKNIEDIVVTVGNEMTRARLNEMYKMKPDNKNKLTNDEKKELKKLLLDGVNESKNKSKILREKMWKIESEKELHPYNFIKDITMTHKIAAEQGQIYLENNNSATSKFSNSFEIAKHFVYYYKVLCEDTDYIKTHGQYANKEDEHQRIFRAIILAYEDTANSEVNNGTGPVDFLFNPVNKKDKRTVVEFKLASNTKLSKMDGQIKKYENANSTDQFIGVIFANNLDEYDKASKFVDKLDEERKQYYVIIKLFNNYVSGSKV